MICDYTFLRLLVFACLRFTVASDSRSYDWSHHRQYAVKEMHRCDFATVWNAMKRYSVNHDLRSIVKSVLRCSEMLSRTGRGGGFGWWLVGFL